MDDLEAFRSAFAKPGMMVFLDGRNEHGTHVLPVLPLNGPYDMVGELYDPSSGSSEAIFLAAEKLGFKAGDNIWTEWRFNKAQYGEYGSVELGEYWEFVSINVDATRVLNQ